MAAVLAASVISVTAVAGDDPVLGHQIFGSGDEKVIVLHDWMGDSDNYTGLRQWLDADSFSYAFADVRGYGKSMALKGDYNTDEVAGDIVRLADDLGWSKFHLVGHSMNGMSGFKAVMNDSKQSVKRIKSFVAVTPVTPDGYPATDDDRAFLSAAITDDETAGHAFGGLTGGKLNAAWSQRKTAHNRATSQTEAVKGYYEMWLNEDFSTEFAKANIQTPVLVIGGRTDLPGFLEDYYKKTLGVWLPNAKFEYIENSGHYPMHETPVLFATLVESHINENK